MKPGRSGIGLVVEKGGCYFTLASWPEIGKQATKANFKVSKFFAWEKTIPDLLKIIYAIFNVEN